MALLPEKRLEWVLARLEVYRDASVQYSASIVSQKNSGMKVTVAEAEAQAVIETDGFTKSIPHEAALYPLLFAQVKE